MGDLEESSASVDRTLQANRVDRGRRNARDPRHAAVGHDGAVRASARGQQPAAGSSRRRQHQSRLDRAGAVDARRRLRRDDEQSARKDRRAPPPRWTSTSAASTKSPARCSENLGDLASQFQPARPRTRRCGDHAQQRQPARPNPPSPTGAACSKVSSRRSTPAPPTSTCGSSASTACSMNRSPPPKAARATSPAPSRNPATPARTLITDQFQAVRENAEAEQRRTIDSMRQIYEKRDRRRPVDVPGRGRTLLGNRAGHEAHGRRHAARTRDRRGRNCAAAFSNCRRRPPKAPRRCAASSSTRSRRWPNSTASSPATAARSKLTEPARARAPRRKPLPLPPAHQRSPVARHLRRQCAAGGSARRAARAAPKNRRRSSAAAERRRCRSQGPGPTAGQTNWLSDLLTRASREGDVRPAATRRGRGAPAPTAERPTRHTIESLELALARYRPHDRPRCRGRTVGPLQSRRAQRVHAQALHDAGPEGVRGSAPPLPLRPRVQADGRPLHRRVRASARGSRRATTAARWWRAPTSPRKPARSTPCWRTRRDGSSRHSRKIDIRNGRDMSRPFYFPRNPLASREIDRTIRMPRAASHGNTHCDDPRHQRTVTIRFQRSAERPVHQSRSR